MAQERVITGEAVEVELPIARLATRTLAILIDATVQYTFVLVLFVGLGTFLAGEDPALAAAMLIATLVFAFLVWPVTFETVTRGRSPGKFALGLRVVRDDGGPIRFRHALVRGLIGVSIEWPGLLFAPLSWLVGATTMLFNSKGKRIGDLAAGTMVLQERLPDRGRYVADMPPHLASWAADLDLTRVDDRLAMAIRQYLSRAHQMRPAARST
ncbi:MAG TPA: RDD family protein, partial [Cryptosporangiaceae bacterium]|nr:RDD family protein [Cryptosporangiaceae bacterium]